MAGPHHAAAAPVLVSAGFFGVAHLPALRGVLYLGALLVAAVTVAIGVGLLRARGDGGRLAVS